MGRFPCLMGRFPTFMGHFLECLIGPFSILKIPWKTAHSQEEGINLLSGPDPLRFLRVALRIEISTRCVFCVAGRIFIGFLSLPNLVLKLNLNTPKRLRVEAAYRSKMLAYCGSNPRFETSGPANSSTKMAYWKSRFQPAAFLRSVFWTTKALRGSWQTLTRNDYKWKSGDYFLH